MPQYLKTYKQLETLGLQSTLNKTLHPLSQEQATERQGLYNQLYIISTSEAPQKAKANLQFTKQHKFGKNLLSDLGLGANTHPYSHLNVTGTSLFLTGFSIFPEDVSKVSNNSTQTKRELSHTAVRFIKEGGFWDNQSALDQYHLLGCLYVSKLGKPLYIDAAELKQSYLAQHSGLALLKVQKASNKMCGHFKKKLKRLLLLLTHRNEPV